MAVRPSLPPVLHLPIVGYGSEEMKQEFRPKLAWGEILMAFVRHRAHSLVDTSHITTKAGKVDGGWVVNSQNVWITTASVRRSPLRCNDAHG